MKEVAYFGLCPFSASEMCIAFLAWFPGLWAEGWGFSIILFQPCHHGSLWRLGSSCLNIYTLSCGVFLSQLHPNAFWLCQTFPSDLFCLVQLLSHALLFVIPWTAAQQASLSITNSWSLLKLMSIESVMTSNHLILCHPLLLLPSVFPSLNVFFSESVVCIRWPKYGSFSFSISPSSEYSGLISFKIV